VLWLPARPPESRRSSRHRSPGSSSRSRIPYQEDLARRSLLPAAMAAATSYVTFAAFAAHTVVPRRRAAAVHLVDLGGAAAVGLAAGVFARLFIVLISAGQAVCRRRASLASTAARRDARRLVPGRAAVTGTNLTSTRLRTHCDGRSIQPQRAAHRRGRAPTRRRTTSTVAGGGVGGLFIPLVIQGALIGASRAACSSSPTRRCSLWSGSLRSSCRLPRAAPRRVLCRVHRSPRFVVPGLIAAVVAQLIMAAARCRPTRSQVASDTSNSASVSARDRCRHHHPHCPVRCHCRRGVLAAPHRIPPTDRGGVDDSTYLAWSALTLSLSYPATGADHHRRRRHAHRHSRRRAAVAPRRCNQGNGGQPTPTSRRVRWGPLCRRHLLSRPRSRSMRSSTLARPPTADDHAS